MPTFLATAVTSDDAQEIVVHAHSFTEALVLARQQSARAHIKTLRLEDEAGTLTVRCGHCDHWPTVEFSFGGQAATRVKCVQCGAQVRILRMHELPARPIARSPSGRMNEAQPTPGLSIVGLPPREHGEHLRPLSVADELRVKLHDPEEVVWHCAGCRWPITCRWSQRVEVQICDDCGRRQYVPARAFEWNSRVMHAQKRKWRAEEAERVRRAEQQRLEIEREAQRRRDVAESEERERCRLDEQRKAAQVEAELKQQALARQRRENLAQIAVAVGFAPTREQFEELGEVGLRVIEAHSKLADELKADLMTALDDQVLADKGVAYGRPAAAAGSILAAFSGYSWVGLALGALAIGARAISDDWKRARLSEYQAKWGKITGEMNHEQLALFGLVFAFKYPVLAQRLSAGGGFLPS